MMVAGAFEKNGIYLLDIQKPETQTQSSERRGRGGVSKAPKFKPSFDKGPMKPTEGNLIFLQLASRFAKLLSNNISTFI